MNRRVVILGASDKPERYAHRALMALRSHGWEPLPVHPRLQSVEGIPTVAALSAIADPVDTVTVYVKAGILESEIEALIRLRPRRVILNPGTESELARASLEKEGIEVLEACTLVLLGTGQF